MKISVILAHPNAGSFNHAIAKVAVETLSARNHQVMFHDLYKEKFDPILTEKEIQKEASLLPIIETHCHEIAQAEGVIIIHPNWWGQPPAILKGWVDRVIRPGVAYEFQGNDEGDGIPRGLLKAKTAVVFNTSNTPAQREKQEFGDPLETIWKNCIFRLCGVYECHRRMFQVVVSSSDEKRQEWLKEVKKTVERYFPG